MCGIMSLIISKGQCPVNVSRAKTRVKTNLAREKASEMICYPIGCFILYATKNREFLVNIQLEMATARQFIM